MKGRWWNLRKKHEDWLKKKQTREVFRRIQESPHFTFEGCYNAFVTQPALTKAFNNWIKTS